MPVFGDTYSKYYNLLYKDKNYQEEYDYIRKIINKHGARKKNILDIGCGTGKHLKYFKDDGFTVAGVDASENMLSEAKLYLNQNNDLICAKASEFKFSKKFDIIISLFHVMSYQTSNNELEKVFMNVSEHLNKDGLFIFDFWYGPAVLTDPPSVRIKRLEDNEIKITRITEPQMRYNENIVDVNYEIMIEEKKTNLIKNIKEKHEMRYLFLQEILSFAEKAYLLYDSTYSWLNFTCLTEKSWYGVVVLEK